MTKKADSPVPLWWEVSTTVNGASVDGFVKSTLLVPDTAFVAPPAASGIAAVHLTPKTSVTRANKAGAAFPLNENNQPTRSATASPVDKANQLTAIVKWLDVENKGRYLPQSNHTYCNIYAYDYCYLAGVYLPRVWWKPGALSDLRKGKSVSPIYDSTVYEINANGLYEWFTDYGKTFGWNATFDFTEMQNAANSGQVVVVSAANKVPNKPGHITVVVPETTAQKAARDGASVKGPLQSEAGARNRKYTTRPWWTLLPNFRGWSFWINRA